MSFPNQNRVPGSEQTWLENLVMRFPSEGGGNEFMLNNRHHHHPNKENEMLDEVEFKFEAVNCFSAVPDTFQAGGSSNSNMSGVGDKDSSCHSDSVDRYIQGHLQPVGNHQSNSNNNNRCRAPLVPTNSLGRESTSSNTTAPEILGRNYVRGALSYEFPHNVKGESGAHDRKLSLDAGRTAAMDSASRSSPLLQSPKAELSSLVDENALQHPPETSNISTCPSERGFARLEQVLDDVAVDGTSAQHSDVYDGNAQVREQIPFDVCFEGSSLQSKATTWGYSSTLNKVFLNLDTLCPIPLSIEQENIPRGFILRATARFTKPQHYNETVVRCPNHEQKDPNFKSSHKDKIVPTSHVVRCENPSAVYETDAASGHHSVYIPIHTRTKSGSSDLSSFADDSKANDNGNDDKPKKTNIIVPFKFMCFSSCPGGINRRPFELQLTIENNGVVFATRSVGIRVCACPLRDKRSEELTFMQKNKRLLVDCEKEEESTGAHGSDEKSSKWLVSKRRKTNIPSSLSGNSLASLSKTVPSTIDKHGNEIFNIKVKGRQNYDIVARVVEGLNALYGDITHGRQKNAEKKAIGSKPGDYSGTGTDTAEESDEEESEMSGRKGQEDKLMTSYLEVLSKYSPEALKCMPVREFLKAVNLDTYYQSFKDNGYDDIQLVTCIDKSDLDILNISLGGHRKKLVAAARALFSRLKGPVETTRRRGSIVYTQTTKRGSFTMKKTYSATSSQPSGSIFPADFPNIISSLGGKDDGSL
eukprot:Nk52_evm78s1737 gene=Nk52_evmTU78s1737